MVNRDLLAAKLALLDAHLARINDRVPPNASALREDQDALDIVAFNLMQSVQICSDISSHLISDEGWPIVRTLAEGFVRLREQGVLSVSTAEALGRAVGLRNVVAHGYAGIDVELCFEAATAGVADLRRFAQEVSAWAQRRTNPA